MDADNNLQIFAFWCDGNNYLAGFNCRPNESDVKVDVIRV